MDLGTPSDSGAGRPTWTPDSSLAASSLHRLRGAGRLGGGRTERCVVFGEQGFMHLHMLEASKRKMGFGAQFVLLSVRHSFEMMELHHLYCEPNACNVAPNRTLHKAGFRYLFSHEATPSAINFPTSPRGGSSNGAGSHSCRRPECPRPELEARKPFCR